MGVWLLGHSRITEGFNEIEEKIQVMECVHRVAICELCEGLFEPGRDGGVGLKLADCGVRIGGEQLIERVHDYLITCYGSGKTVTALA